MTHDFKIGDVIHGFCGGSFGRDSYACRRVEAVGPDWIVTRNGMGDGASSDVELAAGDRLPTSEEANNKSYCDVDCDGPDLDETVARPPRWRCNRTERCFREDGHEGPHGFAGTVSAPNPAVDHG